MSGAILVSCLPHGGSDQSLTSMNSDQFSHRIERRDTCCLYMCSPQPRARLIVAGDSSQCCWAVQASREVYKCHIVHSTSNYLYVSPWVTFQTLARYPKLILFVDILVQATRFDNMADYGCQANFSPSVLSIVLMWLPVLLMGIISLIYLGTHYFLTVDNG